MSRTKKKRTHPTTKTTNTRQKMRHKSFGKIPVQDYAGGSVTIKERRDGP